jgi:hypothetical protein
MSTELITVSFPEFLLISGLFGLFLNAMIGSAIELLRRLRRDRKRKLRAKMKYA